MINYLTQILGKAVLTHDGQRVGKVLDAIATPGGRLPELNAIFIKGKNQEHWISLSELDLRDDAVFLKKPLEHITSYVLAENDMRLQRDILDKQIVDVHDCRVVRVNDVRLAPYQDSFLVIGVDASLRAMLRRAGLQFIEVILRFIGKPLQSNIIAWDEVEALEPNLAGGGRIKLKVPHEKIARLHPADIADIVEQLTPQQRTEVLEAMDVETAADTIQEMETEEAAAVMSVMEEEKAADILEEMEPDDAADLLGDLSDARTEELLEHMQPEDAADVKELLAYDEETAGGIMTTEFISIPETMSAEQTIQRLRECAPKAESIYYVYVTDENNRLVGVISLRDLIVSEPGRLVSQFMVKNVRAVHTGYPADEVAHIFNRYNLLALPVTSEDGELEGIITVDDMMERLLPPEKRRKLPQVAIESE
jgi:CBS domain-containing protein